MEDPFQHVEKLEQDTLDYVSGQNSRLASMLGSLPGKIRKEVSRYYGARRTLSVKVTERGLLACALEDGLYRLYLDGREIYTTGKVIYWIDSDSSGRRTALFETSGSDSGRLVILEDGREKEIIEGTISGILFTDDSYYLVKTFSDGTPPDGGEPNSHRVLFDGKVIFGKGLGPEDFISLYRSGDTAFAVVGNWSRSTVYRGSINDPGTWVQSAKGDYSITPLGVHQGRSYYYKGLSTGAIAADDEVLVQGRKPMVAAHMVSSGFLALHLNDAKVEPVLYDFSGREIRTFVLEIPMGLKDSASDGKTAAISLESFGTSSAIYMLEGEDLILQGSKSVLEPKVEERWADSGGTPIHYFLVSAAGGGGDSALAYGYGGFDIPVVPFYSPLFSLLLSHGISIAVANLRGGNEYGEEWHRAGMGERKQNVFNDFASVIESLCLSGMKVVAYGVSNGGLLAGSMLTQLPELLTGAVIGNPVLDMMRFHRMSVGKYWVPEFGNPDDPADAEFLLKYSPYHNIRDSEYPMSLMYTRLRDDRVHPAHAIKFHMKLSEVSDNTYLRVNTEGGHIGIAPDEMVSEISDIASFVMKCLGKA